MAAKTSAEVVIDGKVYTLSGYEGEEYLQKVAAYINNKISEFDGIEDYRHIPLNMKNTLIQLNIADDYFKAKAQVEKLERDLENKEKELYDLKHDLISNQVKTESAETSVKELEAKNKELLLNKARLEAALEDKLLDGKKLKKAVSKPKDALAKQKNVKPKPDSGQKIRQKIQPSKNSNMQPAEAEDRYIRSLETLRKSGLLTKEEMKEMIDKHKRI